MYYNMLCIQTVEEHYMVRGAETRPCLEVAFDSDEVALEVEEDGVTLDNGWSLVPLVLPTSVRKWTNCVFVHITHSFKMIFVYIHVHRC